MPRAGSIVGASQQNAYPSVRSYQGGLSFSSEPAHTRTYANRSLQKQLPHPATWAAMKTRGLIATVPNISLGSAQDLGKEMVHKQDCVKGE